MVLKLFLMVMDLLNERTYIIKAKTPTAQISVSGPTPCPSKISGALGRTI